MKTKLILGSFLALAGIVNSQIYTPSGVIQGSSGTNKMGIGTASPANKLEVQAASAGDGIRITSGSTGSSALHLNSVPSNNGGGTGGNLWSIYSLGYGDGWGGQGGLAISSDPSTPRFVINGSTGNVGIGTTGPVNGKLEIVADGGSSFNTGLYCTALRTTGSAGLNVGIDARSGSSSQCITGTSYGVMGRAYNSTANYGGYFEGSNNYCGSSFSYGLYASGAYRAAYFGGNLEYTGSLIGPSDRKLKENISHLENVLDKIKLLKPSTYTYKVDEYKDMLLPKGKQMGLIAQELEEVFPELVSDSKEMIHKNEKGEVTANIPGHKSVNYLSLIPVLVAGIQEQQQIIEAQQKQLDEQKKLIDALTQKASGSTGMNAVNVEAGFQVSQNEPNPFTHETIVKYTLPQTVSNAFMAVYDLTGKQITTFPINEKGSSSITITSEKLAAGIYIYSIVADGKVLDSKRMIVAEK